MFPVEDLLFNTPSKAFPWCVDKRGSQALLAPSEIFDGSVPQNPLMRNLLPQANAPSSPTKGGAEVRSALLKVSCRFSQIKPGQDI